MGRKRTHVPLNVFLNSRHVGVLRRKSTGAIDFQYTSGWLDWRCTFPVSLSGDTLYGPALSVKAN